MIPNDYFFHLIYPLSPTIGLVLMVVAIGIVATLWINGDRDE